MYNRYYRWKTSYSMYTKRYNSNHINTKQVRRKWKYVQNLMDVLNEGVIIHDNKNIKYINDKGLEILDINISKKEIFIEDIKIL